MGDEPDLLDGDRAALRAFLQRAETRLSTMHGVAGAFISGAGLLTLLPIFYRDYSGAFIGLLRDGILLRRSCPDCQISYLTMLWVTPFIASLLIPLYALYLLVRQLVAIYLVPHGDDTVHVFPRFALSAISYSYDEGRPDQSTAFSPGKLSVIKAWYREENVNLVVPARVDSEERKTLRSIYDEMNPIYEQQIAQDPILQAVWQQRIKVRDGQRESKPFDFQLYDFRAASAGLSDRRLVEEAARLEASLTRTNYHLRVTVLRYAKSLLILIWTAILLSVCVSFLGCFPKEDTTTQILHYKEVGTLIFGIVWATLTPVVASFPIVWLRTKGSGNADTTTFRKDPDLTGFEDHVYLWCRGSVILAGIGLIISTFWEQIPTNPLRGEQPLAIIVSLLGTFIVLSFAWINRQLTWK